MESQTDQFSSTLMATATAFMEVFTTLDPSTIVPVQADNYKHEFAPTRVNPPQPFNKEKFAAHLVSLHGIMRSFPVRFLRTWVNPSLRQVVIWSDSVTYFHDHVKDSDSPEWEYKGEYIWMLTMDETGEKVEHMLEFLDSKGTDELKALMARAFKKKTEIEGVAPKGVEGGWQV